MIGRLNHVAIAVPDLAWAAALYRDVLGAQVSAPMPLPAHGVTTVFVTLPNTKIELLAPLGENSPIASFLERNPAGGMHHLLLRGVRHSGSARSTDRRGRAGPGRWQARTIGAHGKPVLFLPSQGFRRHLDRAGAGIRP